MEREYREIARSLQISVSTTHRIYKRFENTGDVAALKQPSRGSARKLVDLIELLIIGLVAENLCINLLVRYARLFMRLHL